jgi:hypothetical protein
MAKTRLEMTEALSEARQKQIEGQDKQIAILQEMIKVYKQESEDAGTAMELQRATIQSLQDKLAERPDTIK